MDFAASDLGGEVSVSSLSWSDPDPSIGIALEQSTVGIPFRVLIRTLVNLSLLGKIPRTSKNRKTPLSLKCSCSLKNALKITAKFRENTHEVCIELQMNTVKETIYNLQYNGWGRVRRNGNLT